MAMAKRVFLFLVLNFAIMITLGVVIRVLGIEPYLTARGLNYEALLGFCLIYGMGGAFISLALSRVMAKWMMGVQVIDPRTTDSSLQELVATVHALARTAGLRVMPEVGIYDSPEVNAFATGPTRSRALVAVSTGLLSRMNRREIEGVLGHEIAHVANGDMVTMTLVQGVINAFVMFLARVIAFALTMARGRDSDDREEGIGGSPMAFHLTSMVLEMVFMFLGSMVVAWVSRLREFRADAGGAQIAGRENMIAALQALSRMFELSDVDPRMQPVQTMKISSHGAGLMRLFSSHPPLSDRIARLQAQE